MNEPIISTKEQPGEYDGFETAKPGEPIFGLQGGDPLAPKTVLFWADLARTMARSLADEKQAARLFRKANGAEEVAWAMQVYQRGEADVAGERNRYTDSEVDRSDVKRAIRKTLIDCVGRLNNAAAIIKTVEESLGDLAIDPGRQEELLLIVGRIEALSAALEPRRGNERS